MSCMPAPEDAVLIVLREWLVKAENDLTAAIQIIKMGKAAPMDTICFHAQQCIEKYIKAILVHRAIPVPRTHNIQVLMRLVPPAARPGLTEDEQTQVTNYAVVTRYPDAGLEISLADARKALAIARRFRREVRRLLPRTALRRRRK
jgi:HEPN domain-containing protein